jgi:hypothetical protein
MASWSMTWENLLLLPTILAYSNTSNRDGRRHGGGFLAATSAASAMQATDRISSNVPGTKAGRYRSAPAARWEAATCGAGSSGRGPE